MENIYYFVFFFKKTIDKADHIVCVSNYTRNTLLHYFPNYIEKTSVIYEAAEDRFKPIYNTKKLNNIADKYNLEDKFFLFVGTIEPRKNLENVFRAYHKFKNEISFPLYIVGKIGWRTDNLLKLHKELNLDGKIRMLGYIPDADLPALYNLATAFVYISIDEGFGLPLLEAMQCGTPSIVSNAGSLPEIAGDAALIVDPNSVDHIGKALQRLSVDKQLKDTLIKKGLLRSSNFRWQKTVSELSMLFFELTQKYR
ncbi:glycosyltransferase family 4 protein [Desulfosarcina cetonica]|uniref:glycosyltransferase family 4 protein n=1 Tax=Desulfosarcina cetonica TaxID=90730 RepID=UPI00155D9E46|nr:glycosyltransferase family 1 protein [Desulfosarcina cetonica]